MRHKIILQTNAPFLKTGLAENGRILMNWLARRNKYDLVYYCTATADNDPNLRRMPYKCYGAVPTSPAEQQRFAHDPNMQRAVSYGAYFIDKVIKTEKPSIWIGSDDIWGFPDNYYKSDWYSKINSIMHITIDSIPISPMAYEQAAASKTFLSWANFAVNEMKKQGPQYSHVDYIYGASDTSKFKPISAVQKAQLRKELGIDPRDTIFLFLGRNQLRKEFGSVIDAYALFRKENPDVRAKLLFHTAWGDASNGFDIPRLRDYNKIPKENILSTIICRNCNRWMVKPYEGEDKDCPFCGMQKALASVNGFNQGVPDDELHLIYGLSDASISAFTSGGLEFHNVQSLLCGLPLACTNYSCGEDFCKEPFVFPIKWNARYEHQSSFRKASNDIVSIKNYMTQICRMSAKDREEIGEKGRDWAAKEFHIDTIGGKWEKLFDSMTPPDWSSVTVEYKQKNDKFPMPDIQDPTAWVKSIYNNILMVEPDPNGMKDWLSAIEKGTPRQQIYEYFISIARKDNSEKGAPQDFGSIFDDNKRKRVLFVMKESGGDIFISTALLQGLKDLYPEADLYYACDPKFAEILNGNENVHKILNYHPMMEQELAMLRYVDYYLFPALATQRQLAYLTRDRVGLDLYLKENIVTK